MLLLKLLQLRLLYFHVGLLELMEKLRSYQLLVMWPPRILKKTIPGPLILYLGLGIIIWQFFTGDAPWSHFNGRIEPQIEQGNFLKYNPILNNNSLVVQLIKDCLNLDPENRPTAVDCLNRILESAD